MKFKSTALLLAGTLATLLTGSQAAHAGRIWHWQFPQAFEPVPDFEEYDDEYAYASPYDDANEFDDYYMPPPRKRLRMEEDVAPWWLETPAWKKLRHRKSGIAAEDLEPTYAPGKHKIGQKAKVAAKPVAPVQKPKQVAYAPDAKARPVTPKPILKLDPEQPVKAVASSDKPKIKPPKPSVKTIGCTAGAAVVTGYGFANVTPKTCTGNVYAYNAIRDGRPYIIKLTAAQGEITEVKKQ